MSQLDLVQLKEAFENSQSGGGFRLVDIEQLRDFASYTRTQAAVVCNIETYEVSGDFEIARIDLSIFLGGVDDQEQPAAERIARTELELQEVLTAIEQEGIRCIFQVWADKLTIP